MSVTKNDCPNSLANGSSHCNGSSINLCSDDAKENGKCSTDQQETKSWSILSELVVKKGKEEVPLLFREPHVDRGFRELHRPWTYYFCSVFQLHNESVNVWTHLLALVLMANKLVQFYEHVDFWNDPYSWPLLSGLFGGLMLYACSSGAHCLQSKSEIVHYVAFMIDYSGIGLYGLGSVILHIWYCSENNFYEVVKDFFIPLGGVLAFLICFCNTLAKVIYKRPYPYSRKILQMSPVFGIYVVLVSPIVHRFITCFIYGEDCNESIPYHVQQVVWFAVSGFFFATNIPQCFKPGSFDLFFHSHQLFHVAIMICTLKQMDGVFIDYKTRSDVFRRRPEPTILSCFGLVGLVCLAEVVCVYVFMHKMKKKLKEESKKDK